MSAWWSIVILLVLVGLVPLVDTPLRNISLQRERRRGGRHLEVKADG